MLTIDKTYLKDVVLYPQRVMESAFGATLAA